jgi:hypothetical protein
VAGQAFTGFTSGGVALSGNPGLSMAARPTFDPGPLQGYQNDTYFMYASQMANGLQVAGFNVSHAQADILSREGSNTLNVPTGPSWGWDRTVVIPGLPTAVNGTPRGDPTVGVLPAYNNEYANWSKAGLAPIGGIPNRSTQCGATVTPSGITPPAGGDDASKIAAAIAACTDGQVVQLGSGVFHFDTSESVVIYKGITVRGTGNCTASSIGTNPTTTGTVPLCSTVLTMDNGAWPTYSGTLCGTTTGVPPSGTAPGSFGSCPGAFCGFICMQPSSGALTNFGWGGCFFSGNPTTSNCGTTLTSDAAKGDTTINVTSTANFSVGMWAMIDEDMRLVSTANPTGNGNANILAGSDFLSTSGSPVTFRVAEPDSGCNSNYGLCGSGNFDRLNHDIHLITAKTSTTLTFDSPLTMAFRQTGGHDARVYWPQAPQGTNAPLLQQAGVENLTVTRAVNGPIAMIMCAYCWVKNVEAAYWIHGIDLNYSARPQVTGSFIHDCVDCTNDGAEYPIGVNLATTEALVDNNIILFGGKGMVGRSATAAVAAYNYVDWQRYSPNAIYDGFSDMSVNGSHNAGTHHFLFEGNRGSNCDNDNTHGNAFYHTYFRNHCVGLRADFHDATNCGLLVSDTNGISYTQSGCTLTTSQTGPLRAYGPMSFDYWMAYVANVGGLTGVSTAGNGWAYFRCALGACGANSETFKTIYMTGWSNPDWRFGDQNLDGTNGTPFLFKNRNFDYVTNGIPSGENPTAGFTTAPPSSFYLTSAPSYFAGTNCTYPWPWVTPTAGSPIQSPSGVGCTAVDALPAKARFAAGTPFVQP